MMRFSSWLSIGIGVGVVFAAACGGSVSLGTIGGELGSDGGTSSGGSSGSTSGGTECSDKSLCGPQLGMPTYQCDDGTVGGPTGRCLQAADKSCYWEVRQCPATDGGPAPTSCFDKEGELLDTFKSCTTAADCVVHQFQRNCCGTEHAEGVSKSKLAAAKQCTDTRTAGFPGCDCAVTPTTADDGTTDTGSGDAAQVTCHNNK